MDHLMTRTRRARRFKQAVQIYDSEIECLNEYVLIKIFNFLNINDKLNCTKVCSRWQNILNSTICQPKRLSITVNSNVPIKELNNLNCEHSIDEVINEQLTLTLVDNLNKNLFYNDLFANLNLLILNLIFCDYSPVLDLSRLTCLKHLEIHGDYYEFKQQTVYPIVEHLFVEKLNSSLFEHFSNLKCLCLNQLKLVNKDFSNDVSDDESIGACSSVNQSSELGESFDQLQSIDKSPCNSLKKLKINYLPVYFDNHSNNFFHSLSSIAPNLEQLYISLSFYESSDFDTDLELELVSKIDSNVNILPTPNNLTFNCTINNVIILLKKLKKLKLVEIEFDLDHMTNLNPVNNFLGNISNELSQLKLKLRTHLRFTKSLDLNSTDVFEFANFLKTNYKNQSNEITINGEFLSRKELKSLLRYYHLINVEELYITSKDLALFNKATVYNYLKQVNTLCFEANPGVRFNEILTNLSKVKYIYFDCSTVNQEQINLVPLLKPDLEYLAIEEFVGHLDLEFATKFNCLRSLYLGKLERINITQLVKLIENSKNLNYLNIECKLLGELLDHIVEIFAFNAQQSHNFYHLNLSLFNYQFNSFELESIVQNNKISNLKITFYQP